MNVAALFVRRDTHYADLGCDCYDIERDALTWPGGVPCIAHPPCRGWSQLSHFAKPRPGELELAPWAVAQVRKFGGVVEHPFNSRLWAHVGCLTFGVRDQFGGVLIPVYQSWWGHRALKKSCVYVVGPTPDLPEYQAPTRTHLVEKMGRAERERTPAPFAAWLVDLAQRCTVSAASNLQEVTA